MYIIYAVAEAVVRCVIIDSGYGSAPVLCQTIASNNDNLLSVGPVHTCVRFVRVQLTMTYHLKFESKHSKRLQEISLKILLCSCLCVTSPDHCDFLAWQILVNFVQVMACCLSSTRHKLSQCWFITSEACGYLINSNSLQIDENPVTNIYAFYTYLPGVSVSWPSYQIRKIAGCVCAGKAGNVIPTTNFKETAS